VDTTVADTLVGRVLDGRYQIQERIARGGMATVYRALDTRLDRLVAVKVMHPALAEDPEFVSRFAREARAAAKLSHPNVVAVFDQGNDDGTVFLAMELIPGHTLSGSDYLWSAAPHYWTITELLTRLIDRAERLRAMKRGLQRKPPPELRLLS